MSPIDTKLRFLLKEFAEVGIAVSVVGAGRAKVAKMADAASDFARSMIGERPEVRELRLLLIQRAQDLRAAGTSSAKAAPAMARVLEVLKRIEAIVKRDIVDVPASFMVGSFEVSNAWGYSEKEAKPALTAIESVFKTLKAAGVTLQDDVTIVLDPKWSMGQFGWYDAEWDTIAIDPDGSGGVRSLISAIGRRIAGSQFGSQETEIWKGGGGTEGFVSSLVALSSNSLAPDADARLKLMRQRR